MDGSNLYSILTGTPRVSSLALYEDRDGDVTVYWNDAGKMRRILIGNGNSQEIIKESPARSITVTKPRKSTDQRFYWIESTDNDNSEDNLMSLYVSHPRQSSR